MAHTLLSTPVGPIGLAATVRGVSCIGLRGSVAAAPGAQDESVAARAMLDDARGRLLAWFTGDPGALASVGLDVPGLADGEDFRARALRALRQVPWGATITYGQLAELAGSPRAARAAGTVCSSNPVPLIIPCHRIVPAGGGLGNYGGGAAMKRWLLEREAAGRCRGSRDARC